MRLLSTRAMTDEDVKYKDNANEAAQHKNNANEVNQQKNKDE